ncbi:hypothetical protein AGMMS49991_09810 [Spirochaetia bacterium]|nr:hypothetical protein AGMMS49991_09810 [Spirochaetia bacterium]
MLRRGQHVCERSRKGHGDSKFITADPEGMAIGNRLKAANKSKQVLFEHVVLMKRRPSLTAGGVIQKRTKPEIVKASAKNPPGPADGKGPGYRDKAVPESGQGKNH